MYKIGEKYITIVPLMDDMGEAANATSLPTVKLYRDGVDVTFETTFTVTNLSTGIYSVSGMIPRVPSIVVEIVMFFQMGAVDSHERIDKFSGFPL